MTNQINQKLLEKIREYISALDEVEDKGGAIELIKESLQAEMEGRVEETYKSKNSLVSLAIKAMNLKKEVLEIADKDVDFIVLHHQLVLAEDMENFKECAELKEQIENYTRKESKPQIE